MEQDTVILHTPFRLCGGGLLPCSFSYIRTRRLVHCWLGTDIQLLLGKIYTTYKMSSRSQDNVLPFKSHIHIPAKYQMSKSEIQEAIHNRK